MKAFSGLNRQQRTACLIAGVVVLAAIIAGAWLLMRGDGQVVLNTGVSGGIPEPETAVPLAPIGDSRAGRTHQAVVYYANSDYTRLVATVCELTLESDIEEAVTRAALGVPADDELAALGASDIQLLSLEVSQGVATVNLSIDARRLEPRRMHMLRAAISNSLMELSGISGVNVLIDDREECVIQLPAGTMGRFDNDLAALWQQALAEDQKYEGAAGYALSRDITLYFGAPGGRYLLPEVRSVHIDGDDYLGAVVEQLFNGPDNVRSYERLLPSGGEYLREAPEIVTAADGSKIAVISFNGEISDYFERNGISTALALGSLTRTVCGFVPEVEGVLCDIDGIMVKELYDGDGQLAYTFGDGVMRRSDFDSLVGEMATVYLPADDDSALIPVDTAMSRYDVDSPRALLALLMDEPQESGVKRAIPAGVTDADVLGVRVERSEVLINLSGAFYQVCQGMTPARARTMVYSIVNTMCGLDGIKSVRFYFDGERVDYLAGSICLRGPLLLNAGIVNEP